MSRKEDQFSNIYIKTMNNNNYDNNINNDNDDDNDNNNDNIDEVIDNKFNNFDTKYVLNCDAPKKTLFSKTSILNQLSQNTSQLNLNLNLNQNHNQNQVSQPTNENDNDTNTDGWQQVTNKKKLKTIVKGTRSKDNEKNNDKFLFKEKNKDKFKEKNKDFNRSDKYPQNQKYTPYIKKERNYKNENSKYISSQVVDSENTLYQKKHDHNYDNNHANVNCHDNHNDNSNSRENTDSELKKKLPILETLGDDLVYDTINHDNKELEAEEEVCDDSNGDRGYALKFKHKWRIYVHKAESNDWAIGSFDHDFYTIDSIGTYLQFFNNFYKFNSKQHNFFIMKSQDDGSFIEPTWEHEQNRNGGICSLRIDSLHGVELMQQLCLLMMNESLIPNMELINGISYGVKTNWALIKIWTNNKVEDISKMLPNAIIGQYNNLNMRYKHNVPEY